MGAEAYSHPVSLSLTLRLYRQTDTAERAVIVKEGLVLVNNGWSNCGHATVKEQICPQDGKLLAVSFCTLCLEREFTSVN